MFRASDDIPKHNCKTLGFIYPRARATRWLLNYIRLHNSVDTVIRILLLRLFSIIWGRRNGFEFRSSALPMPNTSSILTTHFPRLFYKSHSTWISVFISISFLVRPTGASVILLSTCPSSLLLTCPCRLFTSATDPLICSFLMLSFFVIPRLLALYWLGHLCTLS